jgi:chemotaxis protein histidine kinase CheA
LIECVEKYYNKQIKNDTKNETKKERKLHSRNQKLLKKQQKKQESEIKIKLKLEEKQQKKQEIELKIRLKLEEKQQKKQESKLKSEEKKKKKQQKKEEGELKIRLKREEKQKKKQQKKQEIELKIGLKLEEKQQKKQKIQLKLELKREEKQKKKELKILQKTKPKKLSQKEKTSAINNIMKNDISLSEVVTNVCPYLDEDIVESINKKYQSIKDGILEGIVADEECDIELLNTHFEPITVGTRYKNKELKRRKNVMYSKTFKVLEYIQSRIFSFICYNNPERVVETVKNFTIDNGTKINNLNTTEQMYYYSENLYIPIITPKSNYQFLKNIKCKFNMLYYRTTETITDFIINGLYVSKYYLTVNSETLRKLVKLCNYEKSKEESHKKICISLSNKLKSDGIVGNGRYISTNWWKYSENRVKPHLSDLNFIIFYVTT